MSNLIPPHIIHNKTALRELRLIRRSLESAIKHAGKIADMLSTPTPPYDDLKKFMTENSPTFMEIHGDTTAAIMIELETVLKIIAQAGLRKNREKRVISKRDIRAQYLNRIPKQYRNPENTLREGVLEALSEAKLIREVKDKVYRARPRGKIFASYLPEQSGV
ncbi:MAG: hypothetical protein PHC51_09680 [bacterium]|nr:hypothetical protein [bacterium]